MLFPFSDNVPSRRTPVVTYAIIALNFIMLLLLLRLPEDRRQEAVLSSGFVPARISQLVHPRPIVVDFDRLVAQKHLDQVMVVREQYVLEPDRYQILLSLFTTMFLHSGWMHLLSNMWFLWIFGDNVEDRLGHVTYFFFYLLGGLMATACHWWNDPASTIPVVGASGAVAAVLGAYFITWPTARVRSLLVLFVFITIVDLPALVVLGIWFLGQVLNAMRVDLDVSGGVAWWAHIGGFLAGMLLMFLLHEKQPPAKPQPTGDLEIF